MFNFNFTTAVLGLSLALSAAVFSPFTAEAFTLTKVPVNNLGLVGWWTFDGKDLASGRANDMSGQGNHGSLVGMATSTSRVEGKIGQGIKFSGAAAEYVDVSHSDSLNPSEITISFWVNIINNPPNNNYGFIDKNSTTGYRIRWSNNTLQAHFGSLTGASSATITQGKWTHVAFVGNASGNRFYIDGVAGTHDADAYTNAATTGALKIGITLNSVDGIMDDVRIYSRALSAAEITALYNSGAGAKIGIGKSQGPANLQNGLVGHWTFDGKDMLTGLARDISGNGNHGSLVNMATSTSRVEGKIGGALQFNGVNSYVRATNVSLNNIEYNVPFSFTAWVYRKNAAVGGVILGKYETSGNFRGYGFFIDNPGGVYNDNSLVLDLISVFSGSNRIVAQTPISSVPVQGWIHVTATYDGGGSYTGVRLYINGASQTVTSPGPTTLSGSIVNSIDFRIGHDYFAYSGLIIDDVRIYNRELSAAEVKQLYQLGAGSKTSVTTSAGANKPNNGLVGHWTFDGKDMLTGQARDISGQGNHGSLVGMATSTSRVEGKVGQALNFDGVDDYIILPSGAAQIGSGDFSVSAWAYITSQTGSKTIIGSRSTGLAGSQVGYGLYTGSGGTNMKFIVDGGDTTYSEVSTANLSTGWHHFVGIFVNGSSVTIYRDGEIETPDTTSIPSGDVTSANTVKIGAFGSANLLYHGQIDDVRVYSRALTAAEILQLYNAGR